MRFRMSDKTKMYNTYIYKYICFYFFYKKNSFILLISINIQLLIELLIVMVGYLAIFRTFKCNLVYEMVAGSEITLKLSQDHASLS